ncbi:MAG: MaoC family dehydratase [Deltaproteobacteria bacterium]|nr:MaoC family dehydratase [Deltaproteobacteria bacterium]
MTAPRLTTLRFNQVKVGDKLPELSVELTPTVIVATAIASRDYQDVHHDYHMARKRGVPEIFMNILSTNGFVGRFITDWAGPEAILKKVGIKLGAPNFAGDTMKMSGSVTAKHDAEKVVEVEVVGKNSYGNHVTGTVRVMLPEA